MNTIEYRVRPVTRYIVTRYESNSETRAAGVSTIGEFDSEYAAGRVMEAMKLADPFAEQLPPHPAPSSGPISDGMAIPD